jgi:S-(hydroxymethyl)glutathione dehydrogenase / alcohol dehydrogenase
MKTEALVAMAPGILPEVHEVELDEPRDGEVLVEVGACGIGPADRLTWSGRDADGLFPFVPGYEAAGRVLAVGPGVTSVKCGQTVIPLVVPECGQCSYCLSGRTNLCQALRNTQGRGVMPDGRPRLRLNGAPLFHYMGVSALARHLVIPEVAAARVDADAPFAELALLCGPIATGMGAVFNVARVAPGESVAVFGLGPIGLAVVRAAALAGAESIVAVEPSSAKRCLAQKFGATHTITPAELGTAPLQTLTSLTGGIDVAFECAGDAVAMQTAIECTRKGWGRTVILGVIGADERLAIHPAHFVLGRQVTGCAYGGVRGRSELGKYLDLYRNGDMPVAPMITAHATLREAGAILARDADCDVVRTIITF